MYLYNKNKRLLEEIEDEEQELIHKNQLEYATNIDNTDNMVYNDNNDKIATYKYVPTHSDDDDLPDDDVEVSRELKIVENENGSVQKEYKIIEKYRKK